MPELDTPVSRLSLPLGRPVLPVQPLPAAGGQSCPHRAGHSNVPSVVSAAVPLLSPCKPVGPVGQDWCPASLLCHQETRGPAGRARLQQQPPAQDKESRGTWTPRQVSGGFSPHHEAEVGCSWHGRCFDDLFPLLCPMSWGRDSLLVWLCPSSAARSHPLGCGHLCSQVPGQGCLPTQGMGQGLGTAPTPPTGGGRGDGAVSAAG